MTQPAKAVIYCRTACSPGMEKDAALHAQERECRSYAKTHGMEVTGVYYDPGISGLTADRPGWRAMIQVLKNALAPHNVLIRDISRLARDFELCDRLQDECKRLGHTITIVDDGGKAVEYGSVSFIRKLAQRMKDYDEDKIDDAVLALLLLTMHDGNRVWKGHDWAAMERLHQRGYISDPKIKAKSVSVTEEGKAMAERLFRQLFEKTR